MKNKFYLIVLVSVFMTACSATTMQAPCDQYAHFCGSKTKINQW